MSALRSVAIWSLTCASAVACAASVPPQDLVSARAAYNRANQSAAPQLTPKDMEAARQQLFVAETAFTENGDTQGTRDQSYLALRKAEFAEVIARTRESDQARGMTVDAMHADEKKTVAGTAAALSLSQDKLKSEQALREAAEKRAQQAAADLAAFASVKQEPRGMVITLSGSVLFASAKSDLLPAAQVKLNDVANALTKEDPLSKIVIEGHTDSQGQPAYNQDLSQRRAQVVRDYLVTRGIASDRVTAQGFGPTRSIAENTTAEGRANNRRVEIVVQPSGAAR